MTNETIRRVLLLVCCILTIPGLISILHQAWYDSAMIWAGIASLLIYRELFKEIP